MHNLTIKEYLNTHKLLTDGAFGTYFSRDDMLPERANTDAPQLVSEIHRAYLEAGAVLLRTNTFASNTVSLGCDREDLKQNLTEAVHIAKNTMEQFVQDNGEKTLFLAGDIGPIAEHDSTVAESVKDEYLFICDTLIEAGVDALLFETFSGFDGIEEVILAIRDKHPELFIITQFSVNQLGYTNAGLSAKSIVAEAKKLSKDRHFMDAVGFNCGVGPGHLHQILKGLDFGTELYVTALPNASYPKLIQNRIVFLENVDYFTEKMMDIAGMGADIVGGCCGTNPSYIKKLAEKLEKQQFVSGLSMRQAGRKESSENAEAEDRTPILKSAFYEKEDKNRKLITVELSPPPNANDEKIMEAAHLLETFHVDAVTFPDSPSGRTRTDSVLMAAKVARETGLKVMPHICCRDKNAIAIRSQFLGAYINGVRNLLLITGDPVPTMARADIKSVFNFDAVGLMKIVREMNEDEFREDPMVFGGAINHNRLNLDVEIKRIKRKMEAGATFFFTQPVFSGEDVKKLKKMKEETGARILCGIMPLVSLKNATFIKNEMAGIHVTGEILKRFRPDMTREEGETVGIGIARDVMAKTADVVDGYYFSIPFNRVYLLKEILKG